MSVYLTNSSRSFGLGDSGNAQVADGMKGMGLDGFTQIATITFVNSVTDFGAYWGANTPPTPATVSLLFSDGSFESFTYSAPHGGTLIWHGWHFETGITSIGYSGDFVAVDGLQANVIPEPATALLGAFGVGLLLFHRRRCPEDDRDDIANQCAASSRRPAGQSGGAGQFDCDHAADRAFPAAVAELGRSAKGQI